uniref:Uncharacterized protein n=1 Tax=Arundo donax TaxID=35708 RepID=A0A0A9F3B9_ARUDO
MYRCSDSETLIMSSLLLFCNISIFMRFL